MLSDTIFYTPASGQIKKAMLMFHGYGSNGHDLISMAPELSKNIENMIFYAPNAPDVLVGDSYKWYDIDEMAACSVYEHFDYLEKLMSRAKNTISGIIDFMRYIEYKHSIRAEDIILMGFSQGALLALMIGLLYAPCVSGVIACSSIPLSINDALMLDEIKSKPSVLLTHGTADDVVPSIGVQMTQNTLTNIGCKTSTHIVNGMGHAIDLSCENAMVNFIQKLD